MRSKSFITLILFAIAILAAPIRAAAQDMPGIEVCTKETAIATPSARLYSGSWRTCGPTKSTLSLFTRSTA